MASALVRTEVLRALLPAGAEALSRGREVIRRLNLIRINDSVLDAAGVLEPAHMRSLAAIHLATARLLGEDLGQVVTYDGRMADAARQLGLKPVAPK